MLRCVVQELHDFLILNDDGRKRFPRTYLMRVLHFTLRVGFHDGLLAVVLLATALSSARPLKGVVVMRHRTFWVSMFLATALTLGLASPAHAQFYEQHNLVSDGAVAAPLVDPALVNPWGLAASATSPWWVSDNGTGKSTLYNGNTGAKVPLTVSVPGAPTGIVFNGGSGFVIPLHGSARFIFASEDGTISAWSGGTQVFVVVNNSASDAVYEGLAIARTIAGDFIYAANFHAGTVDVFNSTFAPVPGGFGDPTIPAGYAPFGIQNLGGIIYVTYALQDADKHDDVPGEGHGYVNAFDTSGNLLRRVASKGTLNSPWGLALAPADFGKFSGDLLVGNFGDGRIHAYDPRLNERGEFQHRGPLHSTQGRPIEIEGLWGLAFGNGANAGPSNTLFFTAGPFDEQHGLFGALVVAEPPGHDR